MGKYSIMDRTNSALLVGLTCCAIVSANTSTGIQSFNTAYYATENENSYGNISTVLKEYKIPQKKFKVETEAQNLFGKMREATLSEQRIIQNNIDKISVPTGFNFLGLMLKEFIDFVDSVLPSVDSEAKDKAKAAIAQFEEEGKRCEYLLPKKLPYLSQGDIISEIPFSYFKEDGSQYIFKARGMVISTSCHIDQKNLINIVPVLPLDFFEGDSNKRRELQENRIFDYMYFPENVMKDYFVDFSKVNTYNKNLIVEGIEANKIERLYSLNQIGFYLFIIKLTVFLMRKEDPDTMESRQFAEAS